MAAKLYVSSHAALRWAQRIEGGVPAGVRRLSRRDHLRAVSKVLHAYHRSHQIPGRLVARLKGGVHKKWSKASYYMTVDAVLVVQGRTVVTVLSWGWDPYVAYLVHEIFGVWPEPDPKSFRGVH